jgi:hypothetical protein
MDRQVRTHAAADAEYFFGRRVESDWKVGSIVTYWMEDDRIDVRGRA